MEKLVGFRIQAHLHLKGNTISKKYTYMDVFKEFPKLCCGAEVHQSQ
jgi:hypothetical protein